MTIRTFDTLEELAACTGEIVGTSDWITIDQDIIDGFADLTGDRQWIHIDQERAASGPFGKTIAHGFLIVSLIPQFISSVFQINETTTGVNYGLNKVRFVSPTPSGSRIRAQVKLLEATPIDGSSFQFLWQLTVEMEGADKPCCVAEWILRRYRPKAP